MYELKLYLREIANDCLIWMIEKINTKKDNGLSDRLHRVADHYDTKPTGNWEYYL